MNIIIMTGRFKQKPALKNGVSFGTFKLDKNFMSVVAFGDTANEMAKADTTSMYIVEGNLSQKQYNGEWRWQVVVNSIKAFQTEKPQSLDNLQPIDSGNLESIDLPDDDLPF